MLFCCETGQGLKPVGVMGGALLQGPLHHRLGDCIGEARVERLTAGGGDVTLTLPSESAAPTPGSRAHRLEIRGLREGRVKLTTTRALANEGKGAIRVGKTLCINPGSMYEQGRLLGAVVNLARNKIKSYILTTG